MVLVASFDDTLKQQKSNQKIGLVQPHPDQIFHIDMNVTNIRSVVHQPLDKTSLR